MFENAKPGDGATYRIHTDCLACTAVSATPRRIVVQRDKATLLNGFKSEAPDALSFEPGGFFGHTSGRQRYEYATDPKGEFYTFSLRKNGRWKLSGTSGKQPGSELTEGRNEYYDFNF
jgi:hypothetical protein